jgi:hypothetical protein
MSSLAARIALLSIVALGPAAVSCGSVTPASDGGHPGAAGSSAGGTGGAAGGGRGGSDVGGTTGTGGSDVDAGPITCSLVTPGDCPSGFTCGCGGPGVGVCTCHRDCTAASQCGGAEPLCGCPGTTGTGHYCVNDCFCTCR